MQALTQTDKEQVTIQVGLEFIHLISHQLLNSASNLQIIHDWWSEPEVLLVSDKADMLRVLQHEVSFLHRLGQYILQFDLASSSKLLLNLKVVNMVDLLKEMLPSFQFQGPSRDFESHYEADLPLVWGDAERLQDVLNNLVSNALKYSAPLSPISISVHRDNDQVRVSVTNSGSSIPAGDENRIFTKFYRGQGLHQSGYGLGLYLARSLIEQHGGRIWVESPAGDAVTTFYFSLPLADQKQVGAPYPDNLNLLTFPFKNGASEANGPINLNHDLGTNGATD